MGRTIRYGALALRPGGAGISTYIREFLAETVRQLPADELSAVVQRDAVGDLPPAIDAVPRPVMSGAARAVLGTLPVGRVDIVHSLDVDLPVRTSARTVATVHDLSVFDVPWAFGRVRATGERLLLRRSLRAADAVVSDSAFTAERLRAVLGVDSIVAPLAPPAWASPAATADVDRVRSALQLPDTFLLHVATAEPRKNLALVAAAARELDVPLVLAGAGTPEAAPGLGALGLGFVAQGDLPALYGAATVVTYASRYEGFGLPPVEAMACGAPVVASRCGGLPDLPGDGMVLVGSEQVDDWVSTIRPLLLDPAARSELRARGLAAARSLTWADTVDVTRRAYR